MKPIVTITTGDPAGVGPEITAKLFRSFSPRRSVAVIVGALSVLDEFAVLRRAARKITIDELVEDRPRSGVFVVDSGCRARFAGARDSKGGGTHAAAALDTARTLVEKGISEAIVTAPISKHALNLAGHHYTGHTEWLADVFDSPDCQMVMVHRQLRVVPITRHIPISRVASAVTADRILAALHVLHRSLREDFGIRQPHIAVAGLNPHAGDGGVIGCEDRDVIEPALKLARRKGLRISGPVAADSLFQSAGRGIFDAFVTMYHDQGLVPFKLLARRRGVNVTIGLPIVRTSVDHGVAFDIAGKGKASEVSLKAAYVLAEKLVHERIISRRRKR